MDSDGICEHAARNSQSAREASTNFAVVRELIGQAAFLFSSHRSVWQPQSGLSVKQSPETSRDILSALQGYQLLVYATACLPVCPCLCLSVCAWAWVCVCGWVEPYALSHYLDAYTTACLLVCANVRLSVSAWELCALPH